MKKLLLTAVVAATALAFVPSHAEVANPTATSCAITPAYTDGAAEGPDEVCTFTSTGKDLQYVVVTPNHWSITAFHLNGSGARVIDAEASASSASTKQGPGTLKGAKAGDTIEVIQGYDSAAEPVSGQGGFMVVSE